MKWRKKAVRSLSLLLVLAMCLGMAAFSVSAEQGETDPCDFVESVGEVGREYRVCSICGNDEKVKILLGLEERSN